MNQKEEVAAKPARKAWPQCASFGTEGYFPERLHLLSRQLKQFSLSETAEHPRPCERTA